jgi:hypothetical protein
MTLLHENKMSKVFFPFSIHLNFVLLPKIYCFLFYLNTWHHLNKLKLYLLNTVHKLKNTKEII